jgi:hypothetical protein
MENLLSSAYVRLRVWLDPRNWKREDAIENVEWIALAAIILVMLVVVGRVLKVGGEPIGNMIVEQIQAWSGQWSPE